MVLHDVIKSCQHMIHDGLKTAFVSMGETESMSSRDDELLVEIRDYQLVAMWQTRGGLVVKVNHRLATGSPMSYELLVKIREYLAAMWHIRGGLMVKVNHRLATGSPMCYELLVQIRDYLAAMWHIRGGLMVKVNHRLATGSPMSYELLVQIRDYLAAM